MKVAVNTLLLFLFSQSILCQHYKFECLLQPAKVYLTTQVAVVEVQTRFKADDAELAELGLFYTFDTRRKEVSVEKTTTGIKDSDGNIPFELKIDSVYNSLVFNGEDISEQTTASLDTSYKMMGIYNGNNIEIHEIQRKGITPEISKMLKSAGEENPFFRRVNFPDSSIAIGGSFSEEGSISIPVPGTGPMEINFQKVYTLSKIESTEATFDILYDFDLTTSIDGSNMQLSGEGNGEMVFNQNFGQVMSLKAEFKIRATNFSESNTGSIVVKSFGETTTSVLDIIEN